MDALVRYFQERDARERLAAIITDRRCSDPSADDFALSQRTLRLHFGEGRAHDEHDAQVVARKPLVLFLAIPTPLPKQLFTTADDRVWDWLARHTHGYEPEPGAQFLVGRPKAFLDGIIYEDERYARDGSGRSSRYVAVERSGIVEMALTDTVYRPYKGRALYALTPMVGLLWQFLGFVTSFYESLEPRRSFSLVVCIRGTEGAWLGGFGEGWAEPFSGFSDSRPECPEPGLLIRREGLSSTMDVDALAVLIRDLATQIDNAWGVRSPRCYVHPNRDPKQPFAIKSFHSVLGY